MIALALKRWWRMITSPKRTLQAQDLAFELMGLEPSIDAEIPEQLAVISNNLVADALEQVANALLLCAQARRAAAESLNGSAPQQAEEVAD